MSAILYLEGGSIGPSSKELKIRCREGFRKLLEKCGYKQQNRMPRLVACGSRGSAFDDFKTTIRASPPGVYIALWIDSEHPMQDINAAWDHLTHHDNWSPPPGASDEQVLLMTTCMETLIVADRAALDNHYGSRLQTNSLPPVVNLENRDRHNIQDALARATRSCTNAYSKGKRSFDILDKLTPATLQTHLPSFARTRRILDSHL